MALAVDGAVHYAHSFGVTSTAVLPALTTTQAGDIIIVHILTAGAYPVSISGSTIGAFTRIHRTAASNAAEEMWACFASAALTSEIVTVTQSNTLDAKYDLYAVSGSNQTSLTGAFETPIGNELGAFNGALPQTYTTTNANTMVVSCTQVGFAETHGPGTGFTMIVSPMADQWHSQYQVLSSAGSVTVQTSGGGGVCLGMIAVAIIGTAPAVTYTADLCTGGVPFANSSANNLTEDRTELTDDNLGTKWLTLGPSYNVSNLFIRNQLSSAATVVSYSLASSEDHPERDVSGWVLEGSNNGTTWTTLDTRTQVSWLSRQEVKTFNFSNSTAYAYYRLNINQLAGPDIGGGSTATIAEIRLWTGTNGTGTNVGLTGTATASDATYGAASLAFDNNLISKWEAISTSWTLGSVIGWWFGYNFATAKAIAKYTITSGNDADERDPQDWVFQYSDDDITWTTADTRTGQDFTGRGQTKTYQFTSPGAHLYWRVFCTKRGDNSTGGLMQVAEIEMMEEVGGVVNTNISPPKADLVLSQVAPTVITTTGVPAVAPLLVPVSRVIARRKPWFMHRAPVDTTPPVVIAIPPSPVLVPGHALLANMLACYLPGVLGGVPVSSIGPTLANGAGGAGTVVSTTEGLALQSNTLGAAKGLTATAPSAFKTWTNFTALWRGLIIGACDAYVPLIGVSIGDTDVSPYFMVNVATDASGYAQVQAYYGDNVFMEVTPSTNVTSLYGSIVDFAVTATVGGNVTLYANGVAIGTNSLTTISTSDSTAKIVVNQGINATNRSPNASVNMACFWDRALSAGEILGLHNAPYSFLTSGTNITPAAGALALSQTAPSVVVATPSATAAFNPADKGTNLVLSNGNLTTTNQFSGDASVRTVQSASSGKYYYEAITAATGTGGYQRGIAFGNASASLSLGLGSPEPNSGNWFQGDGNLYVANSNLGGIGTYAAGDHISVALDLDNNLIWYRKNGGDWNGSSSNNPVNGVSGGGKSTAGVSKPIFVMAWHTGSGVTDTTWNFGATAYVYTPPAGFGNFGAAGGAVDTNIVPAKASLVLSTTAPTVVTTITTTITPASVTLLLNRTAPTAVTTAHVAVTVPAGALTLTGTAPTANASTTISVPKGNLTLSQTAPASVWTDNHPVTVPKADLTLSLTAPVAAMGTRPASASLTLTTTAPVVAWTNNVNIVTLKGALALSQTAPSVATSASFNITPAAASLTLSQTAPTVVTGASVTVSPASVTLLLSQTAPTVAATANWAISPASVSLSLKETAPSVVQTLHSFVTPPSVLLTLSSNAPGVQAGNSYSIVPPKQSLTLSSAAPAVAVTAHVALVPVKGSLTLSQTAPAVGFNWNITPAKGSLTLSQSAPVVGGVTVFAPASASLTISTSAPLVAVPIAITVPKADLLLTGTPPLTGGITSRQPPAGSAVLSSLPPVVAWTNNVNVVPAVGSLTLSQAAPTVGVPVNVNITVPKANLTLSQAAPAVSQGVVRLPLKGGLTLTTAAPTVARTAHQFITVPYAELSLNSEQVIVTRSFHVTISPASYTLNLIELPPRLTVSQNDLAFVIVEGRYLRSTRGRVRMLQTGDQRVRELKYPVRRPRELVRSGRVLADAL